MSSQIDWIELIKDRKGVITKDNQSCGNIIGDDEENIIIEDGAVRQHFYTVPKSARRLQWCWINIKHFIWWIKKLWAQRQGQG